MEFFKRCSSIAWATNEDIVRHTWTAYGAELGVAGLGVLIEVDSTLHALVACVPFADVVTAAALAAGRVNEAFDAIGTAQAVAIIQSGAARSLHLCMRRVHINLVDCCGSMKRVNSLNACVRK